MDNVQHTPGSWVIRKYGTIEPYPGTGHIAACSLRGNLHEMNANARLIAAAPDLLEIIEQCLKRGWMWDNDPSLYDSAAKVVRKAKGE